MTDLVERLRMTAEYGEPALCAEAAAEIERLRELMSNNDTVLKRHLSDASAEIERLRASKDKYTTAYEVLRAEIDSREAEIEWLRTENKTFRDALNQLAQYEIQVEFK